MIRNGFRESAIALYTRGEILSSWQSFTLVFLTTLGIATIISRIVTHISNILFRCDDIDDIDDIDDHIIIDETTETNETEETDSDDSDDSDDSTSTATATATATATDENIRSIQNILASHQDI